MSKKIKRNLMTKKVFIDAAKALLIDQGVYNVSVRKVADLAGYSYATIYNYFEDLNELLSLVKAEIAFDIKNYMEDNLEAIISKEDIKTMLRLHVNYYIEHDHIYDFFFNYKLATLSQDKMESLSDEWLNKFKFLENKSWIQPQEIELIAKTVIYSLNGVLSIVSKDQTIVVEHLLDDLDQVVDFLIRSH